MIYLFQVYDCWATFKPDWTLQLYITFFTVAVYIIPLLILLGAYGRICYVVFKSMVGREVGKRPQQKDKKYSNKISGCENGSLITESDSGSGCKGLTVSNSRGGMTSSNPRAHVKGVSRAKVKTVKLTITVIGKFSQMYCSRFLIATTRQLSCGKVMLSVVSVR